MIELMRANDPVLVSAVKAALAEARVQVFEIDGPVADLYMNGVIPRRLMVDDDDLDRARRIIALHFPEHLPPRPNTDD